MRDFNIKFGEAVAKFESAIHRFKIKKIVYRTIFRGRGLEFESYRNFGQEDDSSLIDWKATLRSNRLLAKQYIEERDLEVYFILDVSEGMIFGSRDKLKAEYAAEVVAALSHLIINSGDKVGLIMFNDGIVHFLPASRNTTQFGLFRKVLSDPNLYGGGFKCQHVLDHVLNVIKSPYAMMVLVSDFINFDLSCKNKLKMLSSKFETIALMIRDPLDNNLPKNAPQMVVQDPYSSNQMIVEPSLVADHYNAVVKKNKQILEDVFKKTDIDSVELVTDKSFVIPLVSFLKSRAGGP